MSAEYQKVTICEQCGKRFWKGYFVSVPSSVSDFNVTKVVCWRCRFLNRIRERIVPHPKRPKG